MMVWVDIETTGLDPTNGLILEVAIVATNNQLVEYACASAIVPHTPDTLDSTFWETTAKDMHETSGLLDICRAAAAQPRHINTIDSMFRDFLDRFAKTKEHPMCGSSVDFDRRWLQAHMPNTHDWFHYRNIDVSTILELAKRWRPSLVERARPNVKAHRALDDIRASIAELRTYRDHQFISTLAWETATVEMVIAEIQAAMDRMGEGRSL